MSNSIVEIEDTKCVFIFGYNASTSHPIVARRINHAKAKGAKIIVCDPRKIETARIADIYAPLANGSNVAFLNAMMNVILEEGLQDQKFIDEHTENFDAFYETVKAYTPECPHLCKSGNRYYLMGYGRLPIPSRCRNRTCISKLGNAYW